jgi:hypothetical protein
LVENISQNENPYGAHLGGFEYSSMAGASGSCKAQHEEQEGSSILWKGVLNIPFHDQQVPQIQTSVRIIISYNIKFISYTSTSSTVDFYMARR